MAQHATVPQNGDTPVSKLARFFPGAIPMRIPVQLSMKDAPAGAKDEVVIEFGTASEVLFSSRLPLEFSERVLLRSANGSLDAEALVVAVQYHGGATAVAARFEREPAQWIVKA